MRCDHCLRGSECGQRSPIRGHSPTCLTTSLSLVHVAPDTTTLTTKWWKTRVNQVPRITLIHRNRTTYTQVHKKFVIFNRVGTIVDG